MRSVQYMCNLQEIGDSSDCSSPSCVQKVWRELGLTIGRIVVLVDGAQLQAETSEILLSFV